MLNEWTDELGQTYCPGDIVAISTISGRSPQMVVAEVLSINECDSKGAPFTKSVREWSGYYRDGRLEYIDKVVPYCSVTARPIADLRGFYRSKENNESKPVTYKIVENIIKLPVSKQEVENHSKR